jgi:hypothetical protein
MPAEHWAVVVQPVGPPLVLEALLADEALLALLAEDALLADDALLALLADEALLALLALLADEALLALDAPPAPPAPPELDVAPPPLPPAPPALDDVDEPFPPAPVLLLEVPVLEELEMPIQPLLDALDPEPPPGPLLPVAAQPARRVAPARARAVGDAGVERERARRRPIADDPTTSPRRQGSVGAASARWAGS